MDTLRHYFDNKLQAVYTRQQSGILFRRLLHELCGVPQNECYFCKDTDFTDKQIATLKAAADRLAQCEPVEYIIGKTKFLNLYINVNPAVLIPRPETEELTALIIDRFKNKKGLSVMDLCCGSGCMAIALSKYLDCENVQALDFSLPALETARTNAVGNSAAVDFIHTDLLNIATEAEEKFLPVYNIVCCNPPYVRNCEKSQMEANVLDYEPHSALFVNDSDPLIFYKAALDFCLKKLSPNGQAFFELNRYLAKETEALFAPHGVTEIVNDLSAAPRFLIFRK